MGPNANGSVGNFLMQNLDGVQAGKLVGAYRRDHIGGDGLDSAVASSQWMPRELRPCELARGYASAINENLQHGALLIVRCQITTKAPAWLHCTPRDTRRLLFGCFSLASPTTCHRTCRSPERLRVFGRGASPAVGEIRRAVTRQPIPNCSFDSYAAKTICLRLGYSIRGPCH